MAEHVLDRRPSLAVPFGLLGALGSYVIMGWLMRGSWETWEISGVVVPAIASVLIGFYLDRRAERGASVGWLALLTSMLVGGAISGAGVGLSMAIGDAYSDHWHPHWADLALLLAGGALFGALMTLAFVPAFSLVFAAWRQTGRAREGSCVAASMRQRVWIATAVGASLYALGKYHHVIEPCMESHPLAFHVVLVAVVVTATCFVSAVRRQRLVAGLTRGLVDRPNAIDDDTTFDLGLGDQRWALADTATHPYRAVPYAISMVRGAIDDVRRTLWTSTALSAAAALVAVGILLGLPSAPTSPPYEVPMAVPAAAAPPPERCSGHSWYNARGPIVVDVNDDGVDDIVGLRWNSAVEDRALAVAAVDGASFRELWCNREIPSQWGSVHTRLVHSGEYVYLTDSEGLLRVYRLSDGDEVMRPMTAPDMFERCASSDGGLWYRSDYQTPDGWEILPDGTRRLAARPASCGADRPMLRALCQTGAEATKQGWMAVPTRQADADRVFLYEPPVRGEPGDGLPELLAFSDETCEALWRAPIPFASDPLHRDPQMRILSHRDVIYSYYQLRDGTWRLGARDGADGGALWAREPLRTDLGSSFHSLTATEDRLYVGLEWRLDVHDARTGEVLGSVP